MGQTIGVKRVINPKKNWKTNTNYILPRQSERKCREIFKENIQRGMWKTTAIHGGN